MKQKPLTWYLTSMLILASLVLGACGSTQPAASTAAPASGGGEVNITYSLWDTNQLVPYQQCATDFMAKNPNIKIEITQMGWSDYWTNLQTSMAAGNAPDVFTNHLAKYPEFASKNQLVDIQPLVERDKVDMSIYLPGLADLWSRDGKRFGLPKDWDTVAVVYNEDMLEKAGITVEELNNATWNPQDGGTFEQMIAKLTLDENGENALDPTFDSSNIVQYGFTPFATSDSGGPYGQTQYSHFAYSNGWKFNDGLYDTKYYYDDPKLIETITWMQNLMLEKHYAIPFTDVASLGGAALFSSGKVAMTTDGSWMITYYANPTPKAGFARLPLGPEGRKSMFNGLADSIWVGSKHQEEAWQWVKYLASPECANIVGEAGVVFPAQEVAVNKAVEAYKAKGLNISAFTLQALEPEGTFLFPVTDHASEITAIMNEVMGSIWLGQADPATALPDANEKVNALFQ
jgi:multiple sugar transport system substrate-binding protein